MNIHPPDDSPTRQRLPPCSVGRLLVVAGLAVMLAGCLQSTDELTLETNGSGKVRLEVHTSASSELLQAMGLFGREENRQPTYPPLSVEDAKRLFPEGDFTVQVNERAGTGGKRIITAEASFKNINALMTSPYAQAHALSIEVREQRLRIRAVAGTEAAARLAELKDSNGMLGGAQASLAELQKQIPEMRSEFRITLPGAVDTGNGLRNGRTMVWSEDRSRHTNQNDYATRLAVVLEAGCVAPEFPTPESLPPRLGRLAFSEVTEGSISGKGNAPAAKDVEKAARFVPHQLRVTRSVDLSGASSSVQNQAILSGTITLPRELAPQRWGEVKLEEVIDAQGQSLKPAERRGGYHGGSSFNERPERGSEGGTRNSEERKDIVISFLPPVWQVQEIARLKASIPMHYPGASLSVVKLTNAIPASWIVDASKAMEAMMGLERRPRALTHPALAALGIQVQVQMGMGQAGFTMLMVQTVNKEGSLTSAQVFDAAGRAWPTYFHREHEDEDGSTCHILVAGQPAPPLSLALLANAAGGGIALPIVLEKIPVRPAPSSP